MANEEEATTEPAPMPAPPKPANRTLTTSSGFARIASPESPPLTARRPKRPRSSSPPDDEDLEIRSPKVSLLNSASLPTVPAFPPAPNATSTDLAPLTPPRSPAKQSTEGRTSPGIAKQPTSPLLGKLAVSEIAPFVRRQRQLLYEMVKAGVIILDKDVIVRVGNDGLLDVDGTRDEQGAVMVGSKVFSKDNIPDGEPPVFIAGSNIHPSLVNMDGKRLTHRDFLKMRGDSIFYSWIVKTLSSLPDMTHERWWDAVDDLQKLRLGKRSQRAIVEPLYKAHIFDTMDRATVHNVGIKLNAYEDLTDEEIDVKLPVAIGRLMGLSPPPELSVGDVWQDQFCAYAFEIDGRVADAATSLFSILKLMAKHPDADAHLRPLAVEKQEELEEAFEAIQRLPGLKSMHKFVESAVKAGWH
ncbi:uncharacterized protein TRIREDRAFT_110773 [Trichoderma reesei QM6a]|uniref:Predicted protein n=2 Tax=Hypocrea jecorina TaxID=51453 RepID=G0RSW8_HYPJQ|nr:uncharacterized protein TRIREDRAFT_110773 [Trichoderma reesei QM6a]EGR45677.1 predicted protein [Trichoderma reesei QM6a]ETS01876.1 hypothetical protein M419DRAFT_130295 [Trichoderma reesei RUT C-30]